MADDSERPAVKPDETYVLAERDYADIVHLENPAVLERILVRSRTEGTAYIGKLLQSGIPRYILAGPKVAFTGALIEALSDLWKEISAWGKAGRIPEDFSGRPTGYQTWVDLLREIDTDPVDAERLKAMKAMFLAANEISATEGQSVIAYQLFQIAKSLKSGELLLLKVVYEAYKEGEFNTTVGTVTLEGWALKMATRLGHSFSTLVITDSIPLEQYGLLNARTITAPTPHAVNENWVLPTNGRITNLGIRFCENIQSYTDATTQTAGSLP